MPVKDNTFGDRFLVSILSPTRGICKVCGVRISIVGREARHFLGKDPHECEPKVKVFTREEIEEIELKRQASK